MDKQTMINAISSRLNSMGVLCLKGEGSDIVIRAEFLNAAWGSGNKKIEFQASAFLNETEKTLYFWELTKESGNGFSFGSNSETSFQSGTTLFRKVKSVGFGPDGKAFEYNIDLGAITKTFKEVAKQFGWKFKVVLKREKASFPLGYVPSYVNINQPQAQYQSQPQQQTQPQPQPQNDNLQQQTQPQSDNTQQTPQPKPQSDNTQQTQSCNEQNYSSSINNTYAAKTKINSEIKRKNGFLFYFPFAIILLTTLVFFGFSGVSPTGWAFGVILLLVIFFTRNKILKLGCLGEIVTWVIIFIMLFVIYAFSIDTSDKKTGESGNIVENNNSQKVEEDSKTPVSMYNYQTGVFTGFHYIDMDARKVRPFLQYMVMLNINNAIVSDDISAIEYRIVNAKVTKKPKSGKPVFCDAGYNGTSYEIADIQKHSFKNGEYKLPSEGFVGITFYVALGDLDYSYTYPEKSTISSDQVILDAGVKSDDVRCEISFDIEVKDKEGKIYYYPLKIELLPGDFLIDQQGEMVQFKEEDKYFRIR